MVRKFLSLWMESLLFEETLERGEKEGNSSDNPSRMPKACRVMFQVDSQYVTIFEGLPQVDKMEQLLRSRKGVT